MNFEFNADNSSGHLIIELIDSLNNTYRLLLDTGTPISIISSAVASYELKDSLVGFQDAQFPTKIVNIKNNHRNLKLNVEVGDVSQLESLGAAGIYGVNDMLGKVFYYDHSTNKVSICSTY